MIRKLTTAVAVAGALAVAVPAIAQADKGGNQGNKTHPAQSHKCVPHNSAYVESGTIGATASTLANSNGAWSGTLVVDVTRTNHAARADKGQTVTYTFPANGNVHVRFGHGVTALTAGERVKLIGKLQTVTKKCTPPSPAATPMFNRVIVLAAAK